MLIQFPTKNIILWMLLGLTILSARIFAQEKNLTQDGLFTITSQPDGALVHMQGEHQFLGRTPFVLPYPVFGSYRIKVSKLGYETVTSEVSLGGEANNVLSIPLVPRTAWKAMSRSLLFPGWGQFYSGRKGMGTLFATVTAGTFIALVQSQRRYHDTYNDYEFLLARFRQPGTTFDEQQRYFTELQFKKQDLKDRESVRNACWYIAGGIWLMNVLESGLFFDHHAQKIAIFHHLSAQVHPDGAGFSLVMSYPFQSSSGK